MIKNFFFLLIIALSSAYSAEYINWFYNYEVGHKEALKLEKPIMLFLKDDKSEESKKMFAKTFLNNKIIEYINKNFVSIQLPKETDKFPLELYYTLEFPALFFATKHEVLFGNIITGYIAPEKLLELMKKYEE